MNLSEVFRIFEISEVQVKAHAPNSVFHGGFDKVIQQFDFSFKKNGSWKRGMFHVTWSTSHTVEHTVKTDATSSDGMRSLFHDYKSVIEHTNDDPTIYEIRSEGRRYLSAEVRGFVEGITTA